MMEIENESEIRVKEWREDGKENKRGNGGGKDSKYVNGKYKEIPIER